MKIFHLSSCLLLFSLNESVPYTIPIYYTTHGGVYTKLIHSYLPLFYKLPIQQQLITHERDGIVVG